MKPNRIEQPAKDLGRTEFILLVSVIMMTVAFAIDSMLPAMPALGTDLGVADANDRPIVITAFLIGFTIAQFFAGAWSDAIGRRKPLMIGLVGYVIASFACMIASDFQTLLAVRVAQGLAAGTGQVVIRSIVRDKFAGRDMAQIMSLASMVFMTAPILAPAMGQLVLQFGDWRTIFAALASIGLLVWLWAQLRITETLAAKNRTPISFASIKQGARHILTERMSIGYTLTSALLATSVFGLLLSVQQIFDQALNSPGFLPLGFAIMSLGMAAASLLNASIVKRFGMRLIGHTGLLLFTIAAAIHLMIALSGPESMISFIVLQTIMMTGFALSIGNFNAIAMEQMGDVAGMANSLQGTASNIIGVTFGTIIGQSFDGTTIPYYTGCLVVGTLALILVYLTEGGRFFTARADSLQKG